MACSRDVPAAHINCILFVYAFGLSCRVAGPLPRHLGCKNAHLWRSMPNAATAVSAGSDYANHVNPRWTALLNLLQMNVKYERCFGSELFTADGGAFSITSPATAS